MPEINENNVRDAHLSRITRAKCAYKWIEEQTDSSQFLNTSIARNGRKNKEEENEKRRLSKTLIR